MGGYNRDRRREPNINIEVNCPQPTVGTVKFYGHIENGVEKRTIAEVTTHSGEVIRTRLKDPNQSREEHLKQARNSVESI